MASLIFRISEGTEAGERRFHFFEMAKDDGEYRYLFLANLVACTDVLRAFGGIGLNAREASADAFLKEAAELRHSLTRKAAGLRVPEAFGSGMEGPDWGSKG